MNPVGKDYQNHGKHAGSGASPVYAADEEFEGSFDAVGLSVVFRAAISRQE